MLKEEQTKMKIEKDSATDRVKNCEYKAAGGPMEEGRERLIRKYEKYLIRNEKSRNTIEKYVFEAIRLIKYADTENPTGEQLAAYKEELKESYVSGTVNTKINAINSWLRFIGQEEKILSTCRIQRRIFLDGERVLGREDYRRLVETARDAGKERTALTIMTIGMTGIRVGELKYIMLEAAKAGFARINFKAKERIILIPGKLREELIGYCERQDIKKGSIFITGNGNPVNRKNIWSEMKNLCTKAGVITKKVYPHNLRHLFAGCYYEKEKDIVRLADSLGHSSIETTRRYTAISSEEACMNQLDLGLFLPSERGRIQ